MKDPTPRELEQRGAGKTICPSDVARELGPADGWRDLMQPARDAAGRLVAAGEVEITQRGEVVDLVTARGPIRIRRTARTSSGRLGDGLGAAEDAAGLGSG